MFQSRNILVQLICMALFPIGVVAKAKAAPVEPTADELKAEILAASGVELAEGEDGQAFLSRLVTEMAGLAEDAWAALTPQAQQWYNDASEQFNNEQPIQALPGDEEAEVEAAPAAPARRAVTAKPAVAAAKPALAAVAAKPAAKPAAVAAKPAAVAAKPAAAKPAPAGAKPVKSSTRIVREIICKDMTSDSKSVLAAAQKVLPDVKPSTVSTVYADTHAVLQVLVDQGVLASFAQ